MLTERAKVIVREYKPSDHKRSCQLFKLGMMTGNWWIHYTLNFKLGTSLMYTQLLIALLTFSLSPSFLSWVSFVLLVQIFFMGNMYRGWFNYVRRGLKTDMSGKNLDHWTAKGKENAGFFVAEVDGLVVGTVAYSKVNGESVEIFRLSVDAQCRKLGIAKKLVEEVAKVAKAHGYYCIIANCSSAQLSALQFYTKAGFEEVNRCAHPGPGYWFCFHGLEALTYIKRLH